MKILFYNDNYYQWLTINSIDDIEYHMIPICGIIVHESDTMLVSGIIKLDDNKGLYISKNCNVTNGVEWGESCIAYNILKNYIEMRNVL